MSLPARIVTLLVAFAAVVAGAVFIVFHYIGGSGGTLPTVNFTASGGAVNVMLQEDPQNNSSGKPDWVSYYVKKPGADPNSQSSWVHTTLFSLPAGKRVNVTILGYDGCTPLRNNYWSYVQGTIGGTISVQQVTAKGSSTPAESVSMLDGWSHCQVGHTFAIPSMHVFVPVGSPNASANLCSSSPCVSGPYTVEKFSFNTPDHGGVFRWQCFVPCGGGFLDGNGGPMQTLGFMTGEIRVVA